MMASNQWACHACTYVNDTQFNTCKICLTPRTVLGGGGASFAASGAASSAPTTFSSTANDVVITPPLLIQKWKSYGHQALTSLTTFSQPTMHIFSNYVTHPPVTFAIPSYCNSSALVASGRNALLSFRFAELAIMACKAALFRDYATYDALLHCRDSREAKALGRRVRPFQQTIWDANQCSIVRDVTIAKLAWDDFEKALVQTGNDSVIAECTPGDWVWGIALSGRDKNVHYPGRWKGMNILGWSLMEARDEATRRARRASNVGQDQFVRQSSSSPPKGNMDGGDDDIDPNKQQQRPLLRMPSAPVLDIADSFLPTTATTTTTSDHIIPHHDKKINPFSISYLATQHSFGSNAFGALQMNRTTPATNNNTNEDLSNSVADIVVSSVPVARYIVGERGRKPVTKMLADIYHRGLFMHGSPTSAINQTIIPAFRHVVGELNKMDAKDTKRVDMVRNLVDSCQDCQQVQARSILRMYSDLTCKTQTLESQLKYSLVRSKEVALQILITKYHSPACDHDHTMIGPERQRAHLWSGYVALIGDQFGLDGIEAAKGDRFLNESSAVIRNVHLHGYSSSISSSMSMSNDDGGSLKQSIMDELTQSLCVKEWLSDLIGDINNQSANADRMIDRSCIFSWATANTSLDEDLNHRIFFDETRAEEYSDLDPKEPTAENKYEPFFSPKVLVEMLVKMQLLKQNI